MTYDSALCVTILTAHRLEYALITARALAANLRHDGDLFFHVASDGDDDNYIGAICDAIREVRGPTQITVSNSGGHGYGANVNSSTMITHGLAAYQLPCEDDWELRRPFDTRPIIDMLQMKGREDGNMWAVWPWREDWVPRSVRLGYLGYRWPVTLHLFKTQEYLWAAFDPESQEQHVFSGHPRLETTEYERAVGLWTEGLNPGDTELAVAGRTEARRGVVWPLTTIALTGSISGDLFGHCGAVRSY